MPSRGENWVVTKGGEVKGRWFLFHWVSSSDAAEYVSVMKGKYYSEKETLNLLTKEDGSFT